jgi:PIN domain nuclease of toxin-antitoxin system
MTERGVIRGAITVEPFTLADAVEAAGLRPLTAKAGLSLGDRSCLALARRLGTPALTADQPWRGIDLPVEVRSIRERKP